CSIRRSTRTTAGTTPNTRVRPDSAIAGSGATPSGCDAIEGASVVREATRVQGYLSDGPTAPPGAIPSQGTGVWDSRGCTSETNIQLKAVNCHQLEPVSRPRCARHRPRTALLTPQEDHTSLPCWPARTQHKRSRKPHFARQLHAW